MRKIFLIAVRDYRAMVVTKAFLVVISIMPILMFGGIAIHKFLERRAGPDEKRIAVLDGTGELLEKLTEAAQVRNEKEIFDPGTNKQVAPRYTIEAVPADAVTDQVRFELSERIRRRQLDAFVEIPAQIMAMPSPGAHATVRFHAENAPLSKEKGWLQRVLNDAVRTHRLEEAGLDPELVGRASTPVGVEPLGLLERSEGGQIEQAQQASVALTIFLPFGMMMLMFMVIFMGAQPMLETVLEEKSQRIAEVLLGSVNAFQLMAGKLLGGVAGSLTILATYVLGGYALACYYDVAHLAPLRIVPWFLVYQVLGLMLFGSIFTAVGAAVSQLKEAQGYLFPVWLVFMFPMFVWFQVIREPTSSFATWLSFVPPLTPLLMVLRVSASTAVPIWQPILGIVLLLATTLLCVFAAARILRIGLLAQGKTPKLSELLRWAVYG